jgi:putative addiction module component (TIGR02574 family)
MAKPALDLAALTPDEKLELIDSLWGSLRSEDFALTSEQQAELDRRLERLDREGPVGTAWEVVRAQMSRRSTRRKTREEGRIYHDVYVYSRGT